MQAQIVFITLVTFLYAVSHSVSMQIDTFPHFNYNCYTFFACCQLKGNVLYLFFKCAIFKFISIVHITGSILCTFIPYFMFHLIYSYVYFISVSTLLAGDSNDPLNYDNAFWGYNQNRSLKK